MDEVFNTEVANLRSELGEGETSRHCHMIASVNGTKVALWLMVTEDQANLRLSWYDKDGNVCRKEVPVSNIKRWESSKTRTEAS